MPHTLERSVGMHFARRQRKGLVRAFIHERGDVVAESDEADCSPVGSLDTENAHIGQLVECTDIDEAFSRHSNLPSTSDLPPSRMRAWDAD